MIDRHKLKDNPDPLDVYCINIKIYSLVVRRRLQMNSTKYILDELITSLRTAVDNEGTLDKEAISYADIFDAFRLAMKFYRFEQQ
jgi:hypothetical protein